MKLAMLPLALPLFATLLPAQITDPVQGGEQLALTHSDSGNPGTPHHYTVDFRARTGRVYVVEEIEDLALGRWRRLPLILLGNENPPYPSRPYAFSGLNGWGEDEFAPISTSSDPLQFDASGERQFVRLRYVEGLQDPLRGDYDRDGVSNHDEVTGFQSDPFAYPDEDATDGDSDGLPDVWERYRLGTLDHAAIDTNAAFQSYADLYAADKRDADGDGLPDDWERFRCGGSLAENASTVRGGKTNLARFREDRVKLAAHRFGTQVFKYNASKTNNAFTASPENPLKVFLLGGEGGSMIISYSDNTYSDIASVRIWPSSKLYGNPESPDDFATHYADYTGSLIDGARAYAYSAVPSTGDYVARDLLRSLDGRPLERLTLGGSPRLRFAPLAITSRPLASVDPEGFPFILRDFPFGSYVFPEFGRLGYRMSGAGLIAPLLDGGALTGLPRLSEAFYLQYPGNGGQCFASWYSHPDALGFTLARTEDGEYSGVDVRDQFFPHRNEVGTRLGEQEFSHAFTTELHMRLDYDSLSDTWLSFANDDDLWIFIDGRLVYDDSGRYPPPRGGGDSLAGLRQLVKERDGEATPFLESSSGSCMVDIFHADRDTNGSTLSFLSNGTLHPVFAYQPIVDADLPTALSYSLVTAPAGMTIDPRGGRILWDYMAFNRDADPGNDVAAGDYPVTLSASDARGYTAIQSFTLHIELPSP